MVEMVIAWALAGCSGGWLAGLASRHSGKRIACDIGLGILGAGIGALVAVMFRQSNLAGVVGFGAWSTAVAFAGAVLFVPIMRTFGAGGHGRRAAGM